MAVNKPVVTLPSTGSPSVPATPERPAGAPRIMAWGVGAFTQGVLQGLKDAGAEVCNYLTRDYALHPPARVGPVFHHHPHPDPCALLRERHIDLVVPMSIDWAQAPWRDAFLRMGIPTFSPTGEAMLIERERNVAGELCRKFGIPFPASHVARNRIEAEAVLAEHPRPFVIKNPLCSPTSPIHTIVCETVEYTCSWLPALGSISTRASGGASRRATCSSRPGTQWRLRTNAGASTTPSA